MVIILELSVESFKEGRNLGFDPSLRKFSIKSSTLIRRVSKPILKVGCNL